MIKTKQYNILHLLSWFPIPQDLTKGNFCLRHVNAIALKNPSVVLIVISDSNIKKNREIKHEVVDNYIQVIIKVKASKSQSSPFKNSINRFRLFKGYNFGLQYIKKNIFIPHLVHLHVSLPLGSVAMYWKWRYNLPYVLSEHWSVYSSKDRRLKDRKIKKKILQINKQAAMITAVSDELKKNMQSYGVKNEIQVIPNVVDLNLFTIKKSLKNEKKQILHVSSLIDDEKNFSGILRVINHLYKNRNDFELHVIHDYDWMQYKPYIDANNLSKYVIFHGKKSMEDLAKWYQKVDFLVMFSNFETFSCVVMEALACGTAVLATSTGAIPEMLAEGRGIIIPPGDEEALFKGMNEMMDLFTSFSPDRLRKFVLDSYDKEIIKNKFYRVYKNVLN